MTFNWILNLKPELDSPAWPPQPPKTYWESSKIHHIPFYYLNLLKLRQYALMDFPLRMAPSPALLLAAKDPTWGSAWGSARMLLSRLRLNLLQKFPMFRVFASATVCPADFVRQWSKTCCRPRACGCRVCISERHVRSKLPNRNPGNHGGQERVDKLSAK